MKKFIFSVVFCFVMSVAAFAQTLLPELDKIKRIKLLESTRDDVQRIFGESESYLAGDKYLTENMHILFFYAGGDCTDETEEWNVAEGKVVEIHVIFRSTKKSQGLKSQISKLERLKVDEEDDEDDKYIHYDKQKGVYYTVFGGEVGSIKFMPPDANSPALCNNDNFRQFNLDSEWFRNKLRDYPVVGSGGRPFANVESLILSRNEILIGCPGDALPKAISCVENLEIDVETKAASTDPTDVLTYEYKITGGRIIGQGARVVWDLSGVEPGKYTITANAHNGCGVCGTTKTMEVVVKKCADCE